MELIENGVALMGINQIPKKHEQCNLQMFRFPEATNR